MSRYIDYDALDYKNWHMIGKSSDFIDGVVYMAQRIEEAPSIDIVRCKECKWFDADENESDSWHLCTRHFGKHINFAEDNFCSYGERREP